MFLCVNNLRFLFHGSFKSLKTTYVKVKCTLNQSNFWLTSMHGSDKEDWGEELAEQAVYYTLKETLVYSNTYVRKECGPGPASFGT